MHRVRLPQWRQVDYDEAEEPDDWLTAVGALVLTPILLLLPLVRVVAELPIAVARGLFGSTRWVEVVCSSPGYIRITWRTTRDRSRQVADEIARRLEVGYEDLTPPGAEFVAMTPPPGSEDA